MRVSERGKDRDMDTEGELSCASLIMVPNISQSYYIIMLHLLCAEVQEI